VVIEDRMKQIKDDIKDTQEAISRFAEQYVTTTGTNQLMREDGEVLQIVKNFKLVKQKKES
jgi:hemerythrin-like domain-containing protein